MAKRTVVLEHYTWDEWVETAASSPVEHPGTDEVTQAHSDTARRMEFCGGWTWDETLERARGEGYHESIDDVETLAHQVEDEITADRFQTTFVATWDVAGSEVDMGRFLSGDPECMVEATPIRVAKHGRAVRIVVPSNQKGGTDVNAIRMRGAAIVALCDVLARLQHPLEVWAAYCNNGAGSPHTPSHQQRTALLVQVQRADEPLDMGRIMLAIAHPAANRRLAWSVKDSIAKQRPEVRGDLGVGLDGGYGSMSREALPEDLPDEQGVQTIILPSFDKQAIWNRATAKQWISEMLDVIFRDTE